MKLTCLFSRTAPIRLAIAVLLLLLATTPSARASGERTTPPAVAGPVSTARPIRVAPPLVAAFLGDRQRIVQVALVVMGVAILILVCGNRF